MPKKKKGNKNHKKTQGQQPQVMKGKKK